jgi:hypothetical protein
MCAAFPMLEQGFERQVSRCVQFAADRRQVGAALDGGDSRLNKERRDDSIRPNRAEQTVQGWVSSSGGF